MRLICMGRCFFVALVRIRYIAIGGYRQNAPLPGLIQLVRPPRHRVDALSSRDRSMSEKREPPLLPQVPIIRLPRPPSPSGRGFDPSSPRALAHSNSDGHQKTRSNLRLCFLRSLLASSGLPVTFTLYQRVSVSAERFNACDIEGHNFQVSNLQTPLGVQKEALIRGPDIISYSFHL
ncbi:gem-associated protein 7 isoform X1 [Engystomops pustulosus]|uniref:gem-associated protein 7 isoform X1 n=1 Tax=Engystomops pustulosus TaxID=76066 RepID=UPI003AFB32D8